MDVVILSDNLSQATVFKQKDCVDNIFISKGNHWIHSSGDAELRIDLRCKIAGDKGDHALDEKLMSNILSLADVKDSHRLTMGTRIEDEFCACTSKGITRYGRTEALMHVVDWCASNNVSRSGWEAMFDKEGIVKEKKIWLTNLEAENLSRLSPRESERVKIAPK